MTLKGVLGKPDDNLQIDNVQMLCCHAFPLLLKYNYIQIQQSNSPPTKTIHLEKSSISCCFVKNFHNPKQTSGMGWLQVINVCSEHINFCA